MPGPGYRPVNSDGTRQVWCPQCRNYISDVGGMSTINTAICIICQCENDGIELTAEQVASLRSVRLHSGFVMSQATVYPETVPDPMEVVLDETQPKEDAHVGRVGYFLKALVSVFRPKPETQKNYDTESKKLAKEKKRRRIFDLPIDSE